MLSKFAVLRERRLKRNEFESIPLREHFKKKYGIEVGLYSYGCFDSSRIASGTKIGRYCSFAPSSYIFGRNHGVHFMSLHPYFYNSRLGVIGVDTISNGCCCIGDDVWVGHNAVILPSVQTVGRGAILAAGAIVTKDVPPYAIVAGNPAIIIAKRFSASVIDSIEASKWWMLDKVQISRMISENKELIYDPERFYAEKG